MSTIANLPEQSFYRLLPAGLISLDERRLISAVVSGYEDRISDLRAYARNGQLFFDPSALPQTGSNVVLVSLVSDQGKAYTRSLDILASTPAPTAPAARLVAWAAAELGLAESEIVSAVYGVDLLRRVDARVIDYLAATVGAVLYRTALLEGLPDQVRSSGTVTAVTAAQQKLMETWFPRLKFKGTPASFDALGRLLGFDDVRMTPLWSRVSPRLPADPGNPVNDPDYAAQPEFYPQQTLDLAYNPHNATDGPYYAWTGTASAGTSATDFYPLAVNKAQPWITVEVSGTAEAGGTILHPSSGSYVLAGGGPHARASVTAGTSPLRFEALVEGDSFNGLAVDVFAVENGTLRGVGITGRLSSVQYRSSYFDLALGADFDKAEQAFGTLVARRNKDLANSPHQVASFSGSLTAVSPYRAYVGGTVALWQEPADWLTPFTGTVLTYVERTQASAADWQQNDEALRDAGQQVVQALEEVRPATRQLRRASVGYSLDDDAGYAPHLGEACLFVVPSGSVVQQWSGSLMGHPLSPYTASMVYRTDSREVVLAGETNDTDPHGVYYRTIQASGSISGVAVYSGTGTNSYAFYAAGTFAERGTVCADYLVTDTEVVRTEPLCAVSGTQVFALLGDDGLAGANQTAVAAMVRAWRPEAILRLGDNNYPDGTAATVAANNAVWADYNAAGRMLAVVGNHDYATGAGGTDLSPHLDYFNIPLDTSTGQKRYYNARVGNVEFFVLNAGWNTSQAGSAIGDANYTPTLEPDGNSVDSIQMRWLQRQASLSTAAWKLAAVHFPPFVSATTTSNYYPGYPRLRAPYQAWGLHAVLSGHVHAYERIDRGIPYFVIGNGGQGNRLFGGSVVDGSQIRYSSSSTEFGATRMVVTAEWIRFEHWTVSGTLVDTFTLTREAQVCQRLERPEDEGDAALETTLADDYPWRTDLVGGGDLVDLDGYTPVGEAAAITPVSADTVALDQTGAEYTLLGFDSSHVQLRLKWEARSLTPYVPGQRAVGFRGTFRNLAQLTDDQTEFYITGQVPNQRTRDLLSDYDRLFTGAYSLYHVGLVDGVLVADPARFNRTAHRQGLVGWLPFNEHQDDALLPVDRGSQLTVLSSNGRLAPTDRYFDAAQGWYLALRAGVELVAAGVREVELACSCSFWVKPAANLGSGATATIFEYGPVSVDLSATAATLTVYSRNSAGIRTSAGSVSLSLTEFNFVAVTWTPTEMGVGVGTLSSSVTLAVVAVTGRAFASTDAVLVVRAGVRAYDLRDLRIWNRVKTSAELNEVRGFAPGATTVPYRLAVLETANRRDRYGLKVLDNGWVQTAALPAWLRLSNYARVSRYTGLGLYQGESRFKEVGLGGGAPPPFTWNLGAQMYVVPADGTAVIATQHGALPGVSQFWGVETTAGTYLRFTGSMASGSVATAAASGSGATPWPNYQEATNPAQDRLWTEGDDGCVYEICLVSSGTGAALASQKISRTRSDAELVLAGALRVLTTTGSVYTVVAKGTLYPEQTLITAGTSSTVPNAAGEVVPSGQIIGGSALAATGTVTVLTAGVNQVRVLMPKSLYFADQPTGAEFQVAVPGTLLSVMTGGTVYQKVYSGTMTRPPAYLYLNSQQVESVDQTNRLTRWQDPTAYGVEQGVPALVRNGFLTFTNSGTLTPGNYRLAITSGNIGQVDDLFRGFKVEIDVGNAVLSDRVLCEGQAGTGFQQTDTFDFSVSETVAGEWLTVVRWFNAYDDPVRGTERRLAVYGYTVQRLSTELYKVSIASSGTVPDCTPMVVVDYTGTGTTPGGWTARYNSYGTLARWQHESRIYPGNDTLASVTSTADLLTGRTSERREDVLVANRVSGTNSPFYTLPDAADPVLAPWVSGAFAVS